MKMYWMGENVLEMIKYTEMSEIVFIIITGPTCMYTGSLAFNTFILNLSTCNQKLSGPACFGVKVQSCHLKNQKKCNFNSKSISD